VLTVTSDNTGENYKHACYIRAARADVIEDTTRSLCSGAVSSNRCVCRVAHGSGYASYGAFGKLVKNAWISYVVWPFERVQNEQCRTPEASSRTLDVASFHRKSVVQSLPWRVIEHVDGQSEKYRRQSWATIVVDDHLDMSDR